MRDIPVDMMSCVLQASLAFIIVRSMAIAVIIYIVTDMSLADLVRIIFHI